MITNSFMVTISHSDSSFWPICLGYFHPFTALEVYILTNIYCWCTNQYSIQMVQSNSVYVSGCRFDQNRFDRDHFELPWTENDSPDQNRIARPRSWVAPHRDPDRDHGPDVPRPNVCIQMSESESGNCIKTFQYNEERTSIINFEWRKKTPKTNTLIDNYCFTNYGYYCGSNFTLINLNLNSLKVTLKCLMG